jgi:DNA-binding transcriptional MerR regulator
MLTVSKLAQDCGLSRSTVLYYESIGLLKAPLRTAGNYRNYGGRELARLRQICLYRNAGLSLADIREVLDSSDSGASSVLKRRLVELDGEIERLRDHQRAILRLLKVKILLRRNQLITKEKWVNVMKAAGFTDADMHRWHAEFEKSAPQEHEEFLTFLHIPSDEIRSIREWSRKQETR